MKMQNRILALALSGVLVVSGFAGCGKTNTATTDSTATTSATTAQATQAKEPVEISVEIFDKGIVPASEGTVDNNRWTKWVNEQVAKIGLKVKFYPVPRNEEVTKINLLLASGSAPDMMYTYNDGALKDWASKGGLYELDEAVKNFGPNIQSKIWDSKPGVKDGGIVQGKLYAICGGTTVYSGNTLFMRKDWLDAVKLGLPTNVDEFYNALKTFKEKMPAINGVKDIVPLATPLTKLEGSGAYLNMGAVLSAFGVEDDYAMVDGQVLPKELQPGYRDYLIYMNKLYKEGLIDSEFALDSDGKRSKEQIFGGKTGAVSINYNWINVTSGAGERLNHDSVANDPNVEWYPVKAFADKNGKTHRTLIPPYGYRLMVPKTSTKVNEVVKYIDWLAAGGAETLFFGVEGEHYTKVNGVNVAKDPEYNKNTLGYLNYEIAAARPFTFDGNYFKTLDPNKKFGEISELAAKLNREDARNRILFDRAIVSGTKYEAQLKKLTEKAVVQAITGNDPGKEYDNFKTEYLKTGGQEFIDEMTKVYNEMNKK